MENGVTVTDSRSAFRLWHCGRCRRPLAESPDYLRCGCCGAVHDIDGTPRPDVEAAERPVLDPTAVRVRNWL
jgi:hypothetical protein